MSGEPSWFDVTKLECFEIETATGAQFPSPIIDWGEQFFLRATFVGSGPDWLNLTSNGFGFVVQFYADGLGLDAQTGNKVEDLNIGQTTGNLVPGQLQYDVDSPIIAVDAEAIYRCGVTVTFRMPNGIGRWHGVLGFNEDCAIQISILEEQG